MATIKEILVLHHSHLDIGYTHAQPILMELQKRYIDEALELCEMTEGWDERDRFRWTCESSYPVVKWLENASSADIDRFRRYARNGQISVSASYMHTTPLASAEELAQMLLPVRKLRAALGIGIKTAIHHDINGVPWPYGQLLLDAGVEFFIMGINIHFGGFPLTRPGAFRWQAPDGRRLTAFNGEHYSLFSQIANVNAGSTAIMAEGLSRYIRKIESNPDYPFDFIYLTATTIPLYDNNPPDRSLAGLIRTWNAEGREPRISFVTPEMLYERVRPYEDRLDVRAGDWTDYWNFGSASSAKETRLNRRTKIGMKAVELLEAFQGGAPDTAFAKLKKQSQEQIQLYDEHTWGAFNSVSEPNHPNVEIQWKHKAHYAYQANSLTGYLLNAQLEKLADNPSQSEEPEGVLLLNASNAPIRHDIRIHGSYRAPGRHLAADRMRHVATNLEQGHADTSYGVVELPPFSWRRIPFRELRPAAPSELIAAHGGTVVQEGDGPWRRLVTTEEGRIETPYHECRFDPRTGRITRLYDKRADWEALDPDSPWTLFQYVQETVDPAFHMNDRSALFPRDADKGNEGVSVWNHDWKARRQTYTALKSCEVTRSANSATLILRWEAPGVDGLEQRLTFFGYRDEIEMKATFYKMNITTPEGLYFAVPLRLRSGWRCHYDTAGRLVELDAEQLPGVCRDYVTVDKSVSIHDGIYGATLICPDAPLVQVGDFHFAKEHRSVPRDADPLLLAWPMNNYWDTNFRARQPGAHTFTYVLSTFGGGFEPAAVMRKAVQAVSPIIAWPSVRCGAEESGALIEVAGSANVSVFDVKPAEDGSGVIVRLANAAAQAAAITLRLPGRPIAEAYRTDALEQAQTALPVAEDGGVSVELEARGMLHVLAIMKPENRK